MATYLAYVVFFTAWNLQLAIDNPDADKIEVEETTTKAETPVTPSAPPAPTTTTTASGSTPATPQAAVGGASSEVKKAN